MKTGVSSYSFNRLFTKGELTLMGAIEKAKEIGFDVMEFSGLRMPEGEEIMSFAAKVKQKCEDVGIEMGNYTIGADFINGSDGDLDAEVERVKGEVRVAAVLGSKGMRHDATRGYIPPAKGSFDMALPRLVEGCQRVTEYAKTMGIKTMMENHGFFAQDSERVEKLASQVNNDNFGLLVDVGNFLCADEDPAVAVGRVAPYAFHVHVKDFHVKSGMMPDPGQGWFKSRAGNYLRGAIIGHGEVPVFQCLKIMKNAGYDGTVSIEFEGMEEPILGISAGYVNLRSYLDQLG